MKLLKILHISDNLMSGAPYRLARVQAAAGLEGRVVNHLAYTNQGARRREYPHDQLHGDSESVLRPVFEQADIVHYHQRWKDGLLFEAHPWAREVLFPKPSLIQFHVPRDDRMERVLRDPRVVKLVVAQYHVRLYPECIPVPNALPIDDELHGPAWIANDPPVVAFTPPDCHSRGWWDKGCAATRAVLERGGFDHVVVTDRSWREAMEARRRCDIAIDEVVTGSYHMCSLEALSQGLATVAALDTLTIDALECVTGTREHPWIIAGLDTLQDRLRELVDDRDYLWQARAASRAYMVRYWRPEILAAKFRALYERVLERHG
jgi:hypothetical protein